MLFCRVLRSVDVAAAAAAAHGSAVKAVVATAPVATLAAAGGCPCSLLQLHVLERTKREDSDQYYRFGHIKIPDRIQFEFLVCLWGGRLSKSQDEKKITFNF